MNLTGNQKIAVALSVVVVFGVLLGGSFLAQEQQQMAAMNNDINQAASAALGAEGIDSSNIGTEVQINELQQGTGATATAGSQVSVHYTGKLADGTVFDSSHSRGEPIAFVLGVGQVIPGWEYGIQGMQVGGKRELVIPPQYAYGTGGVPGVIPGNATLYFEVELMGVE
jgi:FKBP-type peptidyl-prolyl cis-trans isomerase